MIKKERTLNELKIRIDRVIDVKKLGIRWYEYTDKFYHVNIKEPDGRGIGFAVKATGHYGRDMRKVFREIQETLHLK